MSNRLQRYLYEERNIDSDLSDIKKFIKGYMDKRKKLKADMYDNVGKKVINMTKSLDSNEIENFKYMVTNWINDRSKIDEEGLSSDIETIIDAVIEKYY